MKTATVARRAATRKPAPATRIIISGQMEIPLGIRNLKEFREWARSDEFPERGRIDFIADQIEVDTVTEDLFLHGSPKSEIARVLLARVRQLQMGHVFLDCTRVSCPDANLSVEPDIVVVTHAAISEGRVKLVPGQSKQKKRYIELEGPPDLITEVLSDSSVEKDTQRLFRQYYQAGVQEYWVVDARGDDVSFQIYHRGASGFVRAARDKRGFQRSGVLVARYKFGREAGPNDSWLYTLDERG